MKFIMCVDEGKCGVAYKENDTLDKLRNKVPGKYIEINEEEYKQLNNETMRMIVLEFDFNFLEIILGKRKRAMKAQVNKILSMAKEFYQKHIENNDIKEVIIN